MIISVARAHAGPVRKLYVAAHVYMILGLVSGLAYREITKIEHYSGDTQLALVHTHLLALGMLFFLIVLALEKLFTLTANRRLFAGFFWVYNAGLAVTITAMIVHGALTVYGRDSGDAIAGLAGLGHIALTVGLILLFVNLGKRVPRSADLSAVSPNEQKSANAVGQGGIRPTAPAEDSRVA